MEPELSRRLARSLVEQGTVPDAECEVYAYGIQIGMELAANIATTLLIGAWLGMFFESLVFLAAYTSIRSYAMGSNASFHVPCAELTKCKK